MRANEKEALNGIPPQKPKAAAGTTKAAGAAAEDRALAHLLAQGLQLLARNYRTPGRGGGEIDLVMRAGRDIGVRGSAAARLVVVRGAAASVGGVKQRRIVFAARHYLLRFPAPPPCRFDVVGVQGGQLEWLRGAFDAG